MSALEKERLYSLLPTIYRTRDAAEGQPLRALLQVIETELERIGADIDGLYDNWFVETCQEWVVPYIGDLLGVRPIRAVPSANISLRGYVANTLAYRRRKGTAAALEQLAHDTTGWPAHAVEFFRHLCLTEHVNHVRGAGTVNVRKAVEAELVGGVFDGAAHTLDVRSVALRRGRYNIPNVGLFLWRLEAYPVGDVVPGGGLADCADACQVGDHYTFHPCGIDAPLFNAPQSESTLTQLAEEQNVPGRLRRVALAAELDRIRRHDQSRPLRFLRDDVRAFRVFTQRNAGDAIVEVPPERIYSCRLPAAAGDAVAIDPDRGRLILAPGANPHRVLVAYHYGSSGDVGGGPYDRAESVADVFTEPDIWQVAVAHLPTAPVRPGLVFASLREAVAEWHKQPAGATGVITILDSLSELDAGPGNLRIRIPEKSKLLIIGAQWPQLALTTTPARGQFQATGVRPHWRGMLEIEGTAGASSDEPGALFLNGLLLEGSIRVATGNLGNLDVRHCTVVPGTPTVDVASGNDRLVVRIQRSIVGGVRVAAPIKQLLVTQSAVGTGSTAVAAVDCVQTAAQVDESTVFGATRVLSLEASNSIFTATVEAIRRQQGCVRFCYLPRGSRTARRYRCQPDFEIRREIETVAAAARAQGTELSDAEKARIQAAIEDWLAPAFSAATYGDPGYAQLDDRCPDQIRHGSEDESEMGVFCFLKNAHREQNLRTVLAEYLPLGMEAGLFFVS
jgi:hypothetical protein